MSTTRYRHVPSDVPPEEAGPNDLELRGRPAGLPSPEELARLHPDTPFLISYSRISDDWRKNNSKKAAKSAWSAGKGVANQHRRNLKNAGRYGVVIVHLYTDNDLSASKRDVVRPDFQAMLRDLKRGHTPEGYPVHGVICVDQDRVQRTDRDWEDFVEAITLDPSRRFYTPSGPMDLTEESEIIKTGIMAVVNKAESMKKKRRIRDWHQDRILDGLPHSGPRPFGWEEDRTTLRQAESDYLSWAIDERIKGKAMSTLCAEAKVRSLTGSLGGEIVPQTLTQMMTAPRVCGYRANRGQLVLDDDGEPVVGVWETVTTPEKWEAVCATFGAGSTYLARGSGTPAITGIPKTIKYLGSTLLRCQYRIEEEKDGASTTRVCNGAMSGSKATRSKRSPYVYTCGSCSHNAISGPMVDQQLQRLVLAKLKKAEATFIPVKVAWPDEKKLQQKADKLAELERQWQADEVPDAMFYRLAPPLEREVKKLRSERAKFELAAATKNEAPDVVAKRWVAGEYDLSQKRQVLFEIFAAVQVLPGQKGNKKPNPNRLVPVWN
ncbi:recombinase family protein [Kitasatospora sp. NPDC093550]|uniref:recombinase family protein n=1 Tax=Kitasatospora sp. NPDC093550 TaxID=3364089 RepID=UPI00382A5319